MIVYQEAQMSQREIADDRTPSIMHLHILSRLNTNKVVTWLTEQAIVNKSNVKILGVRIWGVWVDAWVESCKIVFLGGSLPTIHLFRHFCRRVGLHVSFSHNAQRQTDGRSAEISSISFFSATISGEIKSHHNPAISKLQRVKNEIVKYDKCAAAFKWHSEDKGRHRIDADGDLGFIA